MLPVRGRQCTHTHQSEAGTLLPSCTHIVEGLEWRKHWIVFAETDFLKADFDSVRGVFDGLAGGMPAQRRVHVIICGKTHEAKLLGARRAASLNQRRRLRFAALDLFPAILFDRIIAQAFLKQTAIDRLCSRGAVAG